jgi:hypothetical protein
MGFGEQGRGHVEPFRIPLQPFAADQLRAFLPADLDIAQILVELVLIDRRTEIGAVLQRVIDFQ